MDKKIFIKAASEDEAKMAVAALEKRGFKLEDGYPIRKGTYFGHQGKIWLASNALFASVIESTFTEEQVWKYPKTWSEYCEKSPVSTEYYIDGNSGCAIVHREERPFRCAVGDKNLLPTKASCEAHMALMQLERLRDAYRDIDRQRGLSGEYNICITRIWPHENNGKVFSIVKLSCTQRFLSFASNDTALEFLNNFGDLIYKAGDLI